MFSLFLNISNFECCIFLKLQKQLQPRLGPKPFSSEPSEISFDQVFSVPQFPSTDDIEETDNQEIVTKEEITLESIGNILPFFECL